jgi:hypothetical protein
LAVRRLKATCLTSVGYPVTHGRYPEAFVRFRETWAWVHSSSWTLIVQWPAEKVVATQLHGEPSPQMRYLVQDETHGSDAGTLDPVSYAKQVAGETRYFAGVVDDPDHQIMHLNLVHAPTSIIRRIQTAFPDTFTINNDAARSWGFVLALQHAIHGFNWKAAGVDIVESWPDQTGHLHIGVSSNVARAQALVNRKYGPGVVRVSHAEPGSLILTHKTT